MTMVMSRNSSMTRLRVRLYIPKSYWHEPIISQMISRYDLTVNITGAELDQNTNRQGRFDLELWGYGSNIANCLNYLASLKIKIVGKPNTEDDSWYC